MMQMHATITDYSLAFLNDEFAVLWAIQQGIQNISRLVGYLVSWTEVAGIQKVLVHE